MCMWYSCVCRVEVWGFCIKMLMTFVSVFVTGQQWMSVFQLIGSFMLCYLYVKWLPHVYSIINHIRNFTHFSVFYSALLLIILAYKPGVAQDDTAALDKFQ
jgi:hypothetical protein